MTARLSAAAILAESARRYPDKVALVLGDTRLTYGQVWGMARRYAAVLANDGVGPGSRVALLLPNIPHFAFAYYGVLSLGATVVPVHALLKADEIAFTLTDSSCTALVTAAPLLAEAAKGAELAGVRLYSVLDSEADAPGRPAHRPDGDGGRAGRRLPAPLASGRGGHPLHVGYDRPAQGRRPHARQHRLERDDVRLRHRADPS